MRRLLRFRPRRKRHWLGLVLLVLVGLALAGLVGHAAPVFCAFHGWRLVHDLRRHHPLWSTYQLWRAVHDCSEVAR